MNKLFNVNEIEEKLNIEIETNIEMISKINKWKNMYQDKPYWQDKSTKLTGLSSAIAREIAKLTTLELHSEIITDNEEDLSDVKRLYKKILKDMDIQIEYAAALGGIMFKPYFNEKGIVIDYTQADSFIPTRYDANGQITGCIFIDAIKRGKILYTKLEEHNLIGDSVIVRNYAFKNENTDFDSSMGKPIPLTEIEEWKDLETEVLFEGRDKPLYAYFKMPYANTIDTKSPLGVSVYSRAGNLLKQADEMWSRIDWEFESKETAIDVSEDYFDLHGQLPEKEKRLYRMLDVDDNGKMAWQIFSPEIRDESLYQGFNKILQRIEFNCGLAYGTLSDVQMVDKTATEIKASKQRTYSTISDIQENLEEALIDLVEIIIYWESLITDKKIETDYEVTFDFDDSLVVDAESEQKIMLMEVNAGLIKPEFYLMERYGVTEEQARDMMPKISEEDYIHDKLE